MCVYIYLCLVNACHYFSMFAHDRIYIFVGSDSSNIEASVSSSSLTSIAAISEESDKLGQIILSTVKQITLSIVTFSNAKRILIPLLLNVPIKAQDSKRTINQSR